MPENIAFVLYPGFVPLDLAGPLDVFTMAGRLARERRLPSPYRFSFVAVAPGPVPSVAGLPMLADTPADACAPHTLLVPGGADMDRAEQDPALLALIGDLATRATRVVSVCTGALLLAACGLLDGRRAATHWTFAANLARRYPAVSVEPDAIFVRDGNVATSAGVTAGIDLALDLVEEDLGPAIALETARMLVVYRRRVGGQSQFSAPLEAQTRAGSRFAALHAWMEARLDERLDMERLAGQAGMSPRHFARVFTAETGMSPGRYVEQLRLDRARELIESGEPHLQTVAAASGFASDEQMRRAFLRRLGMTPSRYADHFAGGRDTPPR